MEPIFAADGSGCGKGLVEDNFFKHPISSLTVFQPVGRALYRCVGGIPGIIIDFATQSVWKPDTNERGVSKIDVDTFLYEIVYDKCPPKKKYNSVEM